jgi:hypothetical protein
MGPNWLELPRDITSNILQRLGVVEILTNACNVCPYWWSICKDPRMWRTIHMSNNELSLMWIWKRFVVMLLNKAAVTWKTLRLCLFALMISFST